MDSLESLQRILAVESAAEHTGAYIAVCRTEACVTVVCMIVECWTAQCMMVARRKVAGRGEVLVVVVDLAWA